MTASGGGEGVLSRQQGRVGAAEGALAAGGQAQGLQCGERAGAGRPAGGVGGGDGALVPRRRESPPWQAERA